MTYRFVLSPSSHFQNGQNISLTNEQKTFTLRNRLSDLDRIIKRANTFL